MIDSFNFIPEDCKGEAADLEIVSFEDSTNSEYPISVAGRESCKYASFNVVTKPRHDIATTIFTQLPFINKLFATSRDTLWVEIPIERSTKIVSEILLIQRKEIEGAQKA